MALSNEERAEITELVRSETRRFEVRAYAGAEVEKVLSGWDIEVAPSGPVSASRARPADAFDPPITSARGRRALGFPLHALLAAVSIGAFTCSFIFDVASHMAPEPYTYPRSSYWLLVIGLASSLVASVTGIFDHRRLAVGSAESSASIRHQVIIDLALFAYIVSFLLRRRTDFVQQVPLGIVALSGLALLALFVGSGVGARLSYRVGPGYAEQDVSVEADDVVQDPATR